jgi:hypothetical protein
MSDVILPLAYVALGYVIAMITQKRVATKKLWRI